MTAIPLLLSGDALRDLRTKIDRGPTTDATRDIGSTLMLAWALLERQPGACGERLEELRRHPLMQTGGDPHDPYDLHNPIAAARSRLRLMQLTRQALAGQTEAAWQGGRELLDDPETQDTAVRFDTHALRASVAQELGQGLLAVHEWHEALKTLPPGAEAVRRRHGQTQLWLAQAEVDAAPVREHALDFLRQEAEGRLAETRAVAHHALGLLQAAEGGDPVRAGEHFLAAVAAADVLGQSRQALRSMCELSRVCHRTGDWALGLEAAEDALAHARLLDWPLWQARCLGLAATCLRRLGRTDEASRAVAEGEQLLQRMQSPLVAAQMRLEVAHIRLQHDQPEEALREAQHVLAMADSGTLGLDRHEALSLTLRAAAALGRLDEMTARLQAEDAAPNPLPRSTRVALWHQLAELQYERGLDAAPALLSCVTAAGEEASTRVPPQVYERLTQGLAAQGRDAEALMHLDLALEALRHQHARERQESAQATSLRLAVERGREEARRKQALAELGVRRAQELQRFNNTLMLLSDVGHELTAHRALADLFRVLDRHLANLVPAKVGLLFSHDEATGTLQLLWSMGTSRIRVGDELTLDSAQGLMATCLRDRRWVSSDELGIELPLSVAEPGSIASALAAPLESKGRLLGLLCAFSDEEVAFGGHDYMTLSMLVSYLAVAMDNSMVYEQLSTTVRSLEETKQQLELSHASLEVASQTDSLTGLWNRRFLQTRITAELDQVVSRFAQWRRAPPEEVGSFDGWTVFVLIDLDHFKRINDTFGHAAGDLVLQQMAQRLLSLSRASDHVVRWGGEEFLMVLQVRHPEDAVPMVERIRASVAQTPFHLGAAGELDVTCSMGHATFPFVWPGEPGPQGTLPPALADSDDWERVVELADLALYHAKRSGRNRATLCLPAAVPPLGPLVGAPEDWQAAGWVSLQAGTPAAPQV